MTKAKELKIYGIVLFFLGLVDIGFRILDIREVYPLLEDYSTAVVVVTYLFIGLGFLMAFAKIWMGRQAICYAKGTGKGTSHIVLAKIGIIFSILILISDAITIFSGDSFGTDIIGTIVSLILMHSYYKAAKACL